MFRPFRVPAIVPMALALLAIGCSYTPPRPPGAGPDPADAAAQVRPLTDVSVTGPYQSFRPVAPGSWREQNERVTPPQRP